MEYIRKKRNLENYTIRSIPKDVLVTDSEGKTVIDESNPKYFYGKIPEYRVDDNGNYVLTPFGQKIENTINVDLFLTQNVDDMGIFTDNEYVPADNTLISKPQGFNSFEYGRLPGAPQYFYYYDNVTVTGNTDDGYLNQVRSYRVDSNNNPIYVPYLNTSDDSSNVFNGVISQDLEKIIYKIGATPSDILNTGVGFTTYKNQFVKTKDEYGKNLSYFKTDFEINNGGWGINNVSLSAITKKEEYLGVVFPPEIDSVVFINRGVADIFERHSLLSELKTTNDVDTNRGGFIRS
tara:strand:+ start:707 stop:1582 length:876 start_codon:yes stop_codon:yes gene_type:complete